MKDKSGARQPRTEKWLFTPRGVQPLPQIIALLFTINIVNQDSQPDNNNSSKLKEILADRKFPFIST